MRGEGQIGGVKDREEGRRTARMGRRKEMRLEER